MLELYSLFEVGEVDVLQLAKMNLVLVCVCFATVFIDKQTDAMVSNNGKYLLYSKNEKGCLE